MEIPPTPLDIWRFYETGGIHPIGGPNPGPETRWITAGQAEYYDTSLNNVAFSHGVIEDDVDAFATYFLGVDESGQPEPMEESVFGTGPEEPNQMVVIDGEALPEPGVSWMLGAGIALLSGLGRWRARAKV